MKINLVSIGNSKGVRIPASIVKECGLGDELEMRVEDGVIMLAPVRSLREGWAESFKKMATNGDDAALLDDALENEFDAEDWTW
ncbi:AbrB/MazE/SpoVT family DNA-binding domain-containing protein [Hoeflea sp. CAU 1731]